jgi:hypothetical protein
VILRGSGSDIGSSGKIGSGWLRLRRVVRFFIGWACYKLSELDEERNKKRKDGAGFLSLLTLKKDTEYSFIVASFVCPGSA